MIVIWRRWESNPRSQSTDISIAAGAIDLFDYVFDYDKKTFCEGRFYFHLIKGIIYKENILHNKIKVRVL